MSMTATKTIFTTAILRGSVLSQVPSTTTGVGSGVSRVRLLCYTERRSYSIIASKKFQGLITTRVFGFGTLRANQFSESRGSSQNRKPRSSSNTLVQTSEQRGAVAVSLGEKVKENAKTATYGGVILLGLAVTGAMTYVILSELFSGDSPNNIYTKSFKLCKANQEVQDTLGSPIKCYGEETRRGWRRHVAHQEFFQGNVKYLRMRFYIEGQFRKGTVHVEKKTNDKGKYEYEYIMVDVDGYPSRRIEVDVRNF